MRIILKPYTEQEWTMLEPTFDYTIFSLWRVCKRWSGIVFEDFLHRNKRVDSSIWFRHMRQIVGFEDLRAGYLIREQRMSHWVIKETRTTIDYDTFVPKKRMRRMKERAILNQDLSRWKDEVARAWRS